MASYNKAILAGNVTRDIQLRYTQSGQAVTEIGIAISRKYKQGNETKEETTFVDVTLWGRTAELASEYLSKGRPVLVEGRLQLDQWQEQDGTKRHKLKVVGEALQFLGSNQGGGGGQQQRQNQNPEPAQQDWNQDGFYDGDDVPF